MREEDGESGSADCSVLLWWIEIDTSKGTREEAVGWKCGVKRRGRSN